MLTPDRFWAGVNALAQIAGHPQGYLWGNENRSLQAVVVAGYQHAPVRAQLADLSQGVRWVQRMRYLAEIFGPETAMEVGMMATLERLSELAEAPQTLDPLAVRASWVQTEPGRLLVAQANERGC